MRNSESLLNTAPFSFDHSRKQSMLKEELSELTRHHVKNCLEYKKIVHGFKKDLTSDVRLEDLPFIPVRLFKMLDLKSIPEKDVFKVLKSSGTSGQRPSKIYIDKEVSETQIKVLTKLTSEFIGPKRLPMLIIDSKKTLRDPKSFSARGAGILGFSIFGSNRTYALDENMELHLPTIEAFLEKHKESDILLFGFTAIVWEKFYKVLKEKNINLPIDKGILIHGGGWKKLVEQSVDNDTYKKCLDEVAGIKKIYNYYGMIEQTGSIFFECEHGHFHTSIYSDIIIRDESMQSLGVGQKGLIQLFSLIPTSYPGHSILSEDYGEILGEDDCPCGRLGKYFKIYGRIKSAEIRGCSDTANH